MSRKSKSSGRALSPAEVVRSFLSLPAAGQEAWLLGLRQELESGDRASAIELLSCLKGDERSWATVTRMMGSPAELTEEEQHEVLEKLQVLKLPKSKARRRW